MCPENKRASKAKSRRKTIQPRDESHRLRLVRRDFYKSRRGRALYRRRGQTVEPFNEWFKSLFELDHRVWHRGLENNHLPQHEPGSLGWIFANTCSAVDLGSRPAALRDYSSAGWCYSGRGAFSGAAVRISGWNDVERDRTTQSIVIIAKCPVRCLGQISRGRPVSCAPLASLIAHLQ